jgi:hypothetical protein
MYRIKHSSLTTQKESGALKGFLRRLIYFLLLNLSPRNAVLSRGTGIMSSKSRTGALVAKTKPMRDTFLHQHIHRDLILGAGLGRPDCPGFCPETPNFPESPGLSRILRVIKPQQLYSG